METGPLYNIKTTADIFTELDPNRKHCLLMFREYKLILDEGIRRDGETSVFVSNTNKHLVLF